MLSAWWNALTNRQARPKAKGVRNQSRRKDRPIRLGVENLEDRSVPTAIPTATLLAPAQPLIGQQMAFTAQFANTSGTATDVGYGPYIDLELPTPGADAPNSGISFVSATYLGQPITSQVLTFDATGHVTHPFAVNSSGNPIVLTGTPGDQFVVLTLPFGSFTPSQPAVGVTVTANVSNTADVGTALTLHATGGFRYGMDPLDNPTTDPPLRGATASTAVTPCLFTISQTYLGPSNVSAETATGPSFVQQFAVSVKVASGQTINNLDLADVLPGNMQFVSVASTTPAGATAISTPSTTTPGGTLTEQFASITGGAGASDAQMVFNYYVPQNDASANPVVNPSTGAAATSTNAASAQGTWTSTDPADSGPVSATAPAASVLDKSVALQQSVADVVSHNPNGPAPTDTLQYTATFQVSDFFALQNLVLNEVISDGQRFDPTFTPTLQVNGNPFTLPAANFTAANYAVTPHYSSPPDGNPNDGTDGTTGIAFNISNEMITRGQNGNLLGGMVNPAGGLLAAPGNGPTTVTVVYRTVIQNAYSDKVPAPDNAVLQGDTLTSSGVVSAAVLNNNTLAPTGSTITDDAAANITIPQSSLQKTLYAINGVAPAPGAVHVAPGDLVTYRITYNLSTSDVKNLTFTDFLPLPIYNATELSGPFNTTVSAAVPADGTAKFGPSDTFFSRFNITPTISTNAAGNSVQFVYGYNNDPTHQPSVVDILFTVKVTSTPFADGLFLTNQAQSSEQPQVGNAFTANAIIPFVVEEPALDIRKGVVSTDNPANVFGSTVAPPGITFAAPNQAGAAFSGGTINSGNLGTTLESTVRNVDAGDRVKFVVVVQNTGSSPYGAFNVELKDALPPGFVIPTTGQGLNLQVTDGTGATLAYTDLGGGLFGNGIELNDPSANQGALGAGKDSSGNVITNGHNILILTYDLISTTAVTPNEDSSSTATLTNYANVPSGPDFTTGEPASTSVTIAKPVVVKTLVGTEINNANNSATQAAIGELVNYSVTVTIPEGTMPGAVITDTLPAGLAFVGQTGFTNSNPAAVTFTGSSTPTVTNNGQTVTWTLGTVTNTDTDNTTPETLTFDYQAVVLDVGSNKQGTTLHNSAVLSWTGNNLAPASAADVTVIEPVITTTNSVVVNGAGTSGDAGDPVVYTITIQNTGVHDAFAATFNDPLPTASSGQSLLDNPTFTVSDSAGLVTSTDFQLIGSNATGWTLQTVPGVTFDLPVSNRTITITINGTLSSATAMGTIPDTATTQYTSLGITGQRSTYNTFATQRTGADGPGGVNNYDALGTSTITVPTVPQKLLVSTSEPSTTGNQVTIGEVARFRLVTTMPEGLSPNVQFVDNLPAGMTFLNDGTAMVAFVASPSPITSSTLSGPGLQVVGDQTTVGTITPTFVLPGSAISGGPFGSGTSPVFSFGDLTNPDRGSNLEYIVLEFNALVDNSAAGNNHAGKTLTDTFAVESNGTVAGTSNPVSLSVVEPSITNFAVTAVATKGDAGAVIPFRMTYTDGNGPNVTSAFNAHTVDALPAGFVLDPTSVVVMRNGTVISSGFTNNSSGNTVDVTLTQVAPGDAVEIDYNAALASSGPNLVMPGQVLINGANLTFTSLPGSNGTLPNPTGDDAPGTPGSATGERDGSGGALNNYAATGSSTVTVNSNSLAGFVYDDANDDGTKQPTESGISGVTITLTGTDHLGNPVNLTAITTGTGAFSFTGLRPSDLTGYTLTETPPGGYLPGTDSVGTAGGNGSVPGVFSAIVLPVGTSTSATGYNYAELAPSSLSGYVFVDGNGDLIKQPGEAGLNGVTVNLTGSDDLSNPVSITMTTDASGGYTFGNLRPGTYQITLPGQPLGYTDGLDHVGSQGGTTGPINTDYINVGLTGRDGVSGTQNNFTEVIAPPVITAVVNSGPINEGSNGSVTVIIPSYVVGPVTYSFDFNNDGIFEVGPQASNTATHYFDDNGNYTVNVRVTNPGGSTIASTVVVVNEVPPTAVISNSGPVNEGSTATVTLSNPFDPSNADTAAGFHYAFDFDNNGTWDIGNGTYAGSPTSPSAVVPALDNPGRVVRARIIDKDGAYTDYLTTIVINNVPPSGPTTFQMTGGPGLLQLNPNIGLRVAPITFSFAGTTDPGPIDQAAGFTYQFDFNSDGVVDAATPPGQPASSTFTWTFDAGVYHPRVRAVDKDGAPGPWISLTMPDTSLTVYAAVVLNNNLYVGGTNTNNNILVNTTNPTAITVSVNGMIQHDPFSGASTFKLPTTGHLVVYTGPANDTVQTPGYLSAEIHCGDGNDHVFGGSGNEVIFGGKGNDYLSAGSGNDVLVGGGGRDTLIGGSGNDILIAGDLSNTAYDTYAALMALCQAWATSGTVPSVLASFVAHSALPSDADLLCGGSGHMAFVYDAAPGGDTVSNYSAAKHDALIKLP